MNYKKNRVFVTCSFNRKHLCYSFFIKIVFIVYKKLIIWNLINYVLIKLLINLYVFLFLFYHFNKNLYYRLLCNLHLIWLTHAYPSGKGRGKARPNERDVSRFRFPRRINIYYVRSLTWIMWHPPPPILQNKRVYWERLTTFGPIWST